MFVKNLTDEVLKINKNGKTLVLNPGVNCVTGNWKVEDIKVVYGPQHVVFITGDEEAETSVEEPAEDVVETPVEDEVDTIVEAPVETPAEVDPATVNPEPETPVEAPAEEIVETVTETVEAPVEAPKAEEKKVPKSGNKGNKNKNNK